MKNLLICSSNTIDKLLIMIKQYYYTENIIINDENKVINTKLNKELGEIVFKNNRYKYFV